MSCQYEDNFDEHEDRYLYQDQLDAKKYEGLTMDEIADLQEQERFRKSEYEMMMDSFHY